MIVSGILNAGLGVLDFVKLKSKILFFFSSSFSIISNDINIFNIFIILLILLYNTFILTILKNTLLFNPIYLEFSTHFLK